MDTYLPATPARILEIGAQNVNGSLRDHAPRNAEYVGLDFDEGDGVDIVVTDVTDWPVPDGHFDMVMASSVFEHDKTFWRTFIAMCQKAKPGGHIYVSAPANGTVHRYPKDYWRFYPDSGLALEEWARSEGLDVTLIESFIAERETEVWNDYCAVFRRGPSDAELNRDFVFNKTRSTNALTWRSSQVINPVDDMEDTRLLADARGETQRWVEHGNFLTAGFATREASWDDERARLTREIEQHTAHIASLDQAAAAKGEQLAGFRAHANELQDELDRLNADLQAQAEERDARTRQVTGELGELQSRLAQRDEEATQAWAKADEREQERDRLAGELQKVKADLVDANGWVEQLALNRTQMERSVTRLAAALATASNDYVKMQRRNVALEERIATLSARPAADARPQPKVEQAAPVAVPVPVPAPAPAPAPAPVVQDAARAEAALQATKSELAESRARLSDTTAALSDSNARLEECRDDIGSLSNMLAAAQDRVAELEHQNEWLRRAGQFLLERGKWWWRFMPSAWQRSNRDRQLIRRELFDVDTYANRYPDVAASGQDPFRHYVYHGVAENRRYD